MRTPIIILMLLVLFDSILTIIGFQHGFEEGNPLIVPFFGLIDPVTVVISLAFVLILALFVTDRGIEWLNKHNSKAIPVYVLLYLAIIARSYFVAEWVYLLWTHF